MECFHPCQHPSATTRAFLPLPGFYREPPVSPEGPENAAWATRADTALATQCPVKIPTVCTEGSAVVPGQGVFAGLRPPDCNSPPSVFTAVLAKTFPQEVEMPPPREGWQLLKLYPKFLKGKHLLGPLVEGSRRAGDSGGGGSPWHLWSNLLGSSLPSAERPPSPGGDGAGRGTVDPRAGCALKF